MASLRRFGDAPALHAGLCAEDALKSVLRLAMAVKQLCLCERLVVLLPVDVNLPEEAALTWLAQLRASLPDALPFPVSLHFCASHASNEGEIDRISALWHATSASLLKIGMSLALPSVTLSVGMRVAAPVSLEDITSGPVETEFSRSESVCFDLNAVAHSPQPALAAIMACIACRHCGRPPPRCIFLVESRIAISCASPFLASSACAAGLLHAAWQTSFRNACHTCTCEQSRTGIEGDTDAQAAEALVAMTMFGPTGSSSSAAADVMSPRVTRFGGVRPAKPDVDTTLYPSVSAPSPRRQSKAVSASPTNKPANQKDADAHVPRVVPVVRKPKPELLSPVSSAGNYCLSLRVLATSHLRFR